jgi:hypothetical protein
MEVIAPKRSRSEADSREFDSIVTWIAMPARGYSAVSFRINSA